MSIRRPKVQENNLWRSVRVIEFEEDKSEENRKKAFAKAVWVLFDYKQEKNYPLLDYFKVADPKNKNITICEFVINEEQELYVSRLFPQFNVKVNNKPIEAMSEQLLQLGDLVEVMDEKFLVHNQGDIPADEAKRLKGLELVNKTVYGLKAQLQEKEQQLKALLTEIEVVQEQVGDIKSKIDKKNNLRTDLQNIISERKRLKEIFIMKRAEFDALYALPLDDSLQKTEEFLQSKCSDQQSTEKEISRLQADIERREKQLQEHNQIKKKMEADKARQEKEKLLKRIQELEKIAAGEEIEARESPPEATEDSLVLDKTGEMKVDFPSLSELADEDNREEQDKEESD